LISFIFFAGRMPQPRKYADDNARKRAYKERHEHKVLAKKREAYHEKMVTETWKAKVDRHTRQLANSRKYQERKKKTILCPTSSTEKSYSCRQSLGKAVSRVSSPLVRSPNKKCAVLIKLVERHNVVSLSVRQSESQWNTLSEESIKLVKGFYQSDNVRWIM
jgi:hypothetical protein